MLIVLVDWQLIYGNFISITFFNTLKQNLASGTVFPKEEVEAINKICDVAGKIHFYAEKLKENDKLKVFNETDVDSLVKLHNKLLTGTPLEMFVSPSEKIDRILSRIVWLLNDYNNMCIITSESGFTDTDYNDLVLILINLASKLEKTKTGTFDMQSRDQKKTLKINRNLLEKKILKT